MLSILGDSSREESNRAENMVSAVEEQHGFSDQHLIDTRPMAIDFQEARTRQYFCFLFPVS
jgi:hypothetical protein